MLRCRRLHTAVPSSRKKPATAALSKKNTSWQFQYAWKCLKRSWRRNNQNDPPCLKTFLIYPQNSLCRAFRVWSNAVHWCAFGAFQWSGASGQPVAPQQHHWNLIQRVSNPCDVNPGWINPWFEREATILGEHHHFSRAPPYHWPHQRCVRPGSAFCSGSSLHKHQSFIRNPVFHALWPDSTMWHSKVKLVGHLLEFHPTIVIDPLVTDGG